MKPSVKAKYDGIVHKWRMNNKTFQVLKKLGWIHREAINSVVFTDEFILHNNPYDVECARDQLIAIREGFTE